MDIGQVLQAAGFAIALAVVPHLVKAHKRAHDETKRRMKDGWLKFLLTHEFRLPKFRR